MARKWRYYVMELTDDGPSRVDGTHGTDSRETARASAKDFARKYPHRRFTIFETHETVFLDPRPEVLVDVTAETAG